MRYVILRDGKELPVEILERDGGYILTVDGETCSVDSRRIVNGLYSLVVDGKSHEVTVFSPEPDHYRVHLFDGQRSVELLSPISLVMRAQGGRGGASALSVKAPMPGRVVRVLVEPGQKVAKGDGVIVVEAMKMQNELRALSDGVVREIKAREGDGVEGGAELVILDAQ